MSDSWLKLPSFARPDSRGRLSQQEFQGFKLNAKG